jgi:hypothetical protein
MRKNLRKLERLQDLKIFLNANFIIVNPLNLKPNGNSSFKQWYIPT